MGDEDTEEIFPVRINGKLICTCGSCHNDTTPISGGGGGS